VIQADGGTRTAAVTGGYVALALAVRRLMDEGELTASPIRRAVCAVSCAVLDGRPVLDPCYAEDHRAEVDMNFVIADDGRFVEVQGTAESEPFSSEGLIRMGRLALQGSARLFEIQRDALKLSER
jgi:ribonuclease PH